MRDSLAQAISTVGIWGAVAVTLAFGVFRASWNGFGSFVLLVVVVAICAAAGWATSSVWGRRVFVPTGRCPKCNYDRTGIAADAKCPECGAMAQ